MNKEVKKEIEVLNSLLEYYKQKQLIAVIFFDGEDRSEINFYKEKRKEVEQKLKEIEEK